MIGWILQVILWNRLTMRIISQPVKFLVLHEINELATGLP
jgi:hypothetical protein